MTTHESCLGCGARFEPEWIPLTEHYATRTDLCLVCRAQASKAPDRFNVAWGRSA